MPTAARLQGDVVRGVGKDERGAEDGPERFGLRRSGGIVSGQAVGPAGIDGNERFVVDAEFHMLQMRTIKDDGTVSWHAPGFTKSVAGDGGSIFGLSIGGTLMRGKNGYGAAQKRGI